MSASKAEQRLCSPFHVGRQMFSHPRKAGLCHRFGRTNCIPLNVPPSPSPSPALYPEDDAIYLGLSLPSCVPPRFLCTLSLPTGLSEKEKRAGCCVSITKTSLQYQSCFQGRSKTQPTTRYCEEKWLYPSQSQHSLENAKFL